MEEAIVHRKRSSRIAMKESEKEQALQAAKKKAEEEEKLARSRRQEARRKKDDDERAKRERAREQRAKERDEREARARAKAERAERYVFVVSGPILSNVMRVETRRLLQGLLRRPQSMAPSSRVQCNRVALLLQMVCVPLTGSWIAKSVTSRA